MMKGRSRELVRLDERELGVSEEHDWKSKDLITEDTFRYAT